MGLKQRNKNRIDFQNIEFDDRDYGGSRQVLFNGSLFSGYVVYDRHKNGNVENEIEYKNGSRAGWENRYNINGQLVNSCLTVGQTILEVYKYDENGDLIDHRKTVEDVYYQEMVTRFQLD